MEQNLSDNEKIIRVVLGVVFLILGVWLNGVVSHVFGLIVIVIAVYLLATYLMNHEPIYKAIGKSTNSQINSE